jgi:protein PET100, fungi type
MVMMSLFLTSSSNFPLRSNQLLLFDKHVCLPPSPPRRQPGSLQSQSFTDNFRLASTNFNQFGMYIMFPIGIMYYFGTNLDSRFSVPDFWPKEGQTHKIPFDKEDIEAELQVLRQRRLEARARRLAAEGQGINTEHTEHQEAELRNPRPAILEATKVVEPEKSQVAREGGKGWFGWFR